MSEKDIVRGSIYRHLDAGSESCMSLLHSVFTVCSSSTKKYCIQVASGPRHHSECLSSPFRRTLSSLVTVAPLCVDPGRRSQKDLPKVRPGQAVADDMAELFVPPVLSFNLPQRFYFLMGEPIPTDPSMAKDKEAYDALYAKVRDKQSAWLQAVLGHLSIWR